MKPEQELLNHFARMLVEKQCSSVIAGRGSGSVVSLGFGELVRLKTPTPNPSLSDVDRNYKSEISLMVYCSWEVLKGEEVLCTCVDDNSNDGLMMTGLRRLKGRTVKRIEIDESSLNFEIRFGDDYGFNVNRDADGTSYDLESDYDLFVNDGIVSVTPSGEIEIEIDE